MYRHIMQSWILTLVIFTTCMRLDYVNAGAVESQPSSTINMEDGFPEELHVSLLIDDNTPVHIRLKRSSTVDPNVPLYVICNGSIFEKNTTGDMASQFYQDLDAGAAIEVSCTNSSEECSPNLRGSFYHDRMLYELTPYFVENDTLAISHRKKRSTESHYVMKRTDRDGNEVYDDPQSVRMTIEAPEGNGRSKRSYKEPRCVELVAVISYDIFDRWFKRSTRFAKWAREEDALFNIRRYFALVVQGVDLRYSSIITVDFSLCVKLSAYVIATTKGDSPWTEEKNAGGSVDGADVLPFFRRWSVHNGGKIGPYDHIQLFTGYDVNTAGDRSAVAYRKYAYTNIRVTSFISGDFMTSSDRLSKAITKLCEQNIKNNSAVTYGLSYISSICLKSWAVSIVEDNLDIMHTTTAATHEIGHSLGAYHDGHRNVCPQSSKYIMSPKIGQPRNADQLNPWKFSQCSVSYFRKTIKLLKRYGVECIANKPRLLDDGQWEFYTQNLPGQLYTPDQQCRLMHGDTSFMSRKLLRERAVSNICTGMWCHSGGSKFTFHIPARGTSCGNKKWCIDGKCKANATAPDLSEKCPYGDYITDIFVGWTCKRLVQHWDYLCIWDYQGMKNKCCDSCAPVLARPRKKRSLLESKRPSDEEIERELIRRSAEMKKQSTNIELKPVGHNSLVNILKSRRRRRNSATAMHTEVMGTLLHFSTSTRLGDLIIGDLPMAA